MTQNSRELDMLKDISIALESIIDKKDKENAIIPDTGRDESILVGTPKSLLYLAKTLIDIVYHYHNRDHEPKIDLEEDNIMGIDVLTSDEIKSAFNEFSIVRPICLSVAPSRQIAQQLMDSLSKVWRP